MYRLDSSTQPPKNPMERKKEPWGITKMETNPAIRICLSTVVSHNNIMLLAVCCFCNENFHTKKLSFKNNYFTLKSSTNHD